MWLLDFYRCPNQRCCVAPRWIMRQCCEAAMACFNTSRDCCVRATSTDAKMRDQVLTLRLRCRRASKMERIRLCALPSTASEQPAGDDVRWMVAATPALHEEASLIVAVGDLGARMLLGLAAAAVRVSPPAPQTQYKCGKSRVRNNQPLGKPEV